MDMSVPVNHRVDLKESTKDNIKVKILLILTNRLGTKQLTGIKIEIIGNLREG